MSRGLCATGVRWRKARYSAKLALSSITPAVTTGLTGVGCAGRRSICGATALAAGAAKFRVPAADESAMALAGAGIATDAGGGAATAGAAGAAASATAASRRRSGGALPRLLSFSARRVPAAAHRSVPGAALWACPSRPGTSRVRMLREQVLADGAWKLGRTATGPKLGMGAWPCHCAWRPGSVCAGRAAGAQSSFCGAAPTAPVQPMSCEPMTRQTRCRLKGRLRIRFSKK